jgi:hypothetical protein
MPREYDIEVKTAAEFARSQTDMVEDVHASVLLDGENRPLALIHVESASAFYSDPGQEKFSLPAAGDGPLAFGLIRRRIVD